MGASPPKSMNNPYCILHNCEGLGWTRNNQCPENLFTSLIKMVAEKGNWLKSKLHPFNLLTIVHTFLRFIEINFTDRS